MTRQNQDGVDFSSDQQVIEKVTFRHPFTLPGLDAPHRPGTFDLVIEREPLDVSFAAHRLRLTLLLTNGSTTEALVIARDDLIAAQQRDLAAPP